MTHACDAERFDTTRVSDAEHCLLSGPYRAQGLALRSTWTIRSWTWCVSLPTAITATVTMTRYAISAACFQRGFGT